MSPDERRAMIIRTALPLVAAEGAAVTTAAIAAAAGVGEATVFRVFQDKEELLDACLAEALRPDNALDAIAEIPLDQPLLARLTEATEALEAHVNRMGRVLGAMQASGYRAGRNSRTGDSRPARPGGTGRTDSIAQTRAAVAALFEPDAATLRLPPDQLAGVLLDLLYARSRSAEPLDTATLTELFLFGAITSS
jgi:AcrR family transcriptional regulator